jgi:hypothetical protein
MSKAQKNRKPVAPVQPKKAQMPVKNPDNSNMYKALWYACLIFLAVLFFKQMGTDTPKKREKKTSYASFSNWLSGYFQENYEKDMLAKPFFVDMKKYRDEHEYSLLGKVNLDDFFVGKDDFIFAQRMTSSYYGDDFIGRTAVQEEVRKALFVQNKVKEFGIQFLVLFAPGKGTIYSEFLPDNVLKTEMKTTNSQVYIEECKKQNVNYLDFINYFLQLKKTTQYPLFPQYGSHWSYYAECVAIDTTIKRLENLMNTNLPNLQFGNVKLMDTALVRDGDIFRKMSIDIPKGNPLAYPQQIGYEQGPGVAPQKILAIGDSYFRGFFYLGAMQNAFDNSQQWYYYNSIIPESPDNPEIWELDLKAEILKTKAVVILCNENNLLNLGNGFIDDAYLLFSDPVKYDIQKRKKYAINSHKKQIRNDKEMLYRLTKESHMRGITLDSVITETATKLAGKDK